MSRKDVERESEHVVLMLPPASCSHPTMGETWVAMRCYACGPEADRAEWVDRIPQRIRCEKCQAWVTLHGGDRASVDKLLRSSRERNLAEEDTQDHQALSNLSTKRGSMWPFKHKPDPKHVPWTVLWKCSSCGEIRYSHTTYPEGLNPADKGILLTYCVKGHICTTKAYLLTYYGVFTAFRYVANEHVDLGWKELSEGDDGSSGESVSSR